MAIHPVALRPESQIKGDAQCDSNATTISQYANEKVKAYHCDLIADYYF